MVRARARRLASKRRANPPLRERLRDPPRQAPRPRRRYSARARGAHDHAAATVQEIAMLTTTRRRFLGEIGQGMLAASLGPALAEHLAPALAAPPSRGARRLGSDLEALIARMRETEADELVPWLVGAIKSGTELDTLVTAGALANARTFGGVDYEGYHCFMALWPARAMALQMPRGLEPLPVLKVLRRNTARIRTAGARTPAPAPAPIDAVAGGGDGAGLRELVRDGELSRAQSRLVRACAADPLHAFDELQPLVQDDINVHRIVLACRAHQTMAVAGFEHVEPLLRQVVGFCDDEEQQRKKRGYPPPAVRDDVPRVLEQHELLSKAPGQRQPDDAWISELAQLVFASDRARAADAAAAALAEGFDPEAVGEAISLAANQLLRHDTGKNRVHGASVGVHASDAANAWRSVARVWPAPARLASLVVAAYHTAGQSEAVGPEQYAFQDELDRLSAREPSELLRAAAAAIEQRDQRGACAAVQRYGELGHPYMPAFKLLVGYAVSEDGALHAEKYFHTVSEEFAATRPAFRWRHLVGLARVTASEFGEPAPGVAEARRLLEA
jgi:hypothetical protein